MSFFCCDWCTSIFSSSKNKNQEKKPYKPSSTQDLDEQQLITHNLAKEANQLPTQYFQPHESQKDHSKQMNVELKLQQTSEHQQQDRHSEPSSKGQNQHQNNLNWHDQNQQPEQAVTQQKLKPDYTKFSINLDPYDKFYKLLHQKTDNLQKYFTIEGKPIEIGQTKSNLKIQKLDNNKFSARYELPCSYSFYSMLTKDSNISNKKYMTHFERHQILEAFKPNFTKNMTRIKRFNMLEPRQFVYLKYSNGSFKENWEICINDPEDDLLAQQEPTDHKKCDIFAVSNFKEINDRLYVRHYVEVDLKSTNMNANIWGKIIHEVKEYVEKLYLHVQAYYQKQLL